MPVPDLFAEGLARGWKTYNGSRLEQDLILEADVAIIGSGAGGSTAAETLSTAGYKVLIIEEGPLKTSSDFKMLEGEAFPQLYQEGAGRMTKDGAILVFQGRAVGGSTLVNWTSSFRTPEGTLDYWRNQLGIKGHSPAEMAPWFEKMEQRLGVAPWAMPPNANNDVLRRGCDELGYHWKIIPRNVRGCWNLGYCGLGCPTNAKQSMLVTSIPATLEKQGELLYLARAERLLIKGEQIRGILCQGMDERSVAPNGYMILVTAKHYVLAGGGINSPAVLLRSNAPDPYERIGKRTFIHPVNFSAAQFKQVINPFYGAPQSVYCDEFQWDDGIDGRMSYKLEVPPLQPGFASILLGGFGESSAQRMQQLPHTNMLLALLRDGFHPQSTGGTVELRRDGSPVLDYPMNDYAWDGIHRAFQIMAEIQFAAGAKEVRPGHSDATPVKTLSEAKAMIDGLNVALYRTRLATAHLMGGCAMSEDPSQGVTDSLGRHHQLGNLSILDGSLFPTSIGANPQLSIYLWAGCTTGQRIGRTPAHDLKVAPKRVNLASRGWLS